MRRHIPGKTKQLVFDKAGYRCSFPGCEVALTTESGVFIGEIGHIEEPSAGGPRGNPEVDTRAEENLIVLCPTHHALVDREPGVYSVKWLKTAKWAHL